MRREELDQRQAKRVSGTIKRRLRFSRDTILFLAGLAGVAYETLVTQAERPTLLLLFAGMMGLPAFLKSDEKHQPVPPPEVKQRDTDEHV